MKFGLESICAQFSCVQIDLPRMAISLHLAGYLVAAMALTAHAHAANSWVEQGLAISSKNLQVEMIGGDFEDDSSIAVSRDAKYIAYTRVDPDLPNNVNVASLWLIEKDSPRRVRQIGESIRTPGFGEHFRPSFSPNGIDIAYMANKSIVVASLVGAGSFQISPERIPKDSLGVDFMPSSIRSFAWSPDGNRLGVIVVGRSNGEIRSGIELTSGESYWTDPNTASARLAVYDTKSDQWNAVGPATINVASFDWSPRGDRLVFAGSPAAMGTHAYMHNNLYITDFRGEETRKIQLRPGVNNAPLWSPDGRWIAFQSQGGRVRHLAYARIGLYEVETDTLSYPGYDELGRKSGYGVGISAWSPDSRSLLLRVPYRLSKQLFKILIPQGTLTRFTQDDDNNSYAARYTSDGRSIVYLSESFFQAPNIFISPARRFQPRRLTDVSSDIAQSDVELRQLSWPSRDGRWIIHGWLLLPKQHARERTRPLLVYAEGGPMMVSPWFRTSWQYPIHALIANGVAVLIPNSRGREGYGMDFQSAWETERDPGQGQLNDDLNGVDVLVKSGVVDPDRVALAGHSWGGYLAAYALTHTNQFKAIFVHEAVSLNLVEEGFAIAGNESDIDFARELGKGSPLEGDDMDRLQQLSPIYQTASATTPALLEFGANSLIKDGDALFQGLKHFNVQTELISYPRTGHIIEEPALRLDAARRDLEWFAYWVLGKPTKRMLDRYGPAKIAQWNPEPGGAAVGLH